MNAIVVRSAVARGLARLNDHRTVLAVFAATLFVSAMLLFSVQPVFAKIVLPQLGGSPSVWAVSMCFFQAALLAGYCYAHLLNRYVPLRRAPLVHLAVMTGALMALPFGLPGFIGDPPADNAYLWLIAVLSAGVGLPFFAVSANAPLLQAWFARTGHPDAHDPYFLYGASNLGSLIALLSYPVVFEPLLGLKAQATLWTNGFVLLGAGVIGCSLLLYARLPHKAPMATPTTAGETVKPPLNWPARLHWIALAFVPSGLLVAFTTHLTTDLASAPFLWVIPLATFLATFIVVFCHRPLIPHGLVLALQPLTVSVTAIGLIIPGAIGWNGQMAAGFAAFVTTTLVCHRLLYERRPDSAYLTEFYLWMSLGGVLGGVFSALLAPQIFNTVQEYPLLLVAGIALRPGVLGALRSPEQCRQAVRMALLLTLAGAVSYAALAAEVIKYRQAEVALGMIAFVAGMVMLAHLREPAKMVGAALGMGACLIVLAPALAEGESVRSFFGVHRVLTTPDRTFRLLVHGTTVHGAQRLRDKSGVPVAVPTPATYYYPGGPMARGVAAARTASGKAGGALKVGVVGLGTGSMMCFSRPGEAWTFFEIDPAVERIARDPARFDFLSRCGPDVPVVIGDARLTLKAQKKGVFDYLLIDAFSSDAVPVHLLTTEALRLYVSRLSKNGLLALHISNRHMDLQSVAAATAAAVPGTFTAVVSDAKGLGGMDGAKSRVFFIAKSEKALDEVRRWPDAGTARPNGVRAWTDDYSNVFAAIMRSAWGK